MCCQNWLLFWKCLKQIKVAFVEITLKKQNRWRTAKKIVLLEVLSFDLLWKTLKQSFLKN